MFETTKEKMCAKNFDYVVNDLALIQKIFFLRTIKKPQTNPKNPFVYHCMYFLL
jgi:hypothetical protein